MTSMAEAVTILRAFHYNEIQNVDLSLLRDKGHGWSVLKALHLNINENEKKIATQEENMNCTFVHCTRSRSCFISVNSSAPHVYTCSSCRDTVYYLRSNKVRQGLSAGPKKQIQPLFSRRPARIDWWWMEQPLCGCAAKPCLEWRALFWLCGQVVAAWDVPCFRLLRWTCTAVSVWLAGRYLSVGSSFDCNQNSLINPACT